MRAPDGRPSGRRVGIATGASSEPTHEHGFKARLVERLGQVVIQSGIEIALPVLGKGIGGEAKKTFFGLTFEGSQSVLLMIVGSHLTAPILTHTAKQILDNFDSEGWELVQIAPGMNPENLVGYFKRPVEG